MRKAILIAASLLLASPALPHSAGTWEYDRECCASYDCAVVRDPTIEVVPGGFRLTLPPGSHPMVPQGASTVTGFIPYNDPRIRVSGDEFKHACVSPGGFIYCIYLPPGGV